MEDLEVYRRLCQLHIDVCRLTHTWPAEERYELGSQARRSSNSSPAQLAEKSDDRHLRNKIEGVNRSRGEAGETIHHLYMALLKKYITSETYADFRTRYKEALPGLWGDFSLSGERVHVQSAEVEEDVDLQPLAVAVAA